MITIAPLIYAGKVIPVHTLKAYGGSGGLAPFVLNLGAKCRFTVGKVPYVLVIVKYEDR